jgi:two-component system, sensor histidine kinase and response regulator
LKQCHAQRNSISLILSDVNMPEFSGFTLAEWIRAESQFDKVQIIMLTSSGREGDAARRDELRIAVRLMKPIKQSELFDAIVTTLGVAAMEASSHRKEETALALTARPLDILLAEDNAANQKLAIGVLTKQGHRVTVAGNGRVAVAAWQTQRFDVILMDVQMPEMDGLQATAAIRQIETERGGHILIVAMTAHAMKGDRERCLEAGMDDYLPKPIRAKQIAEKLFSLFGAAPVSDIGDARQDEPQSKPSLAMAETVCVSSDSVSATIDWKAALEGVDQDRELLSEVIELFLTSATDTLSQLRDALARHQRDVARRLAHSLKGELLAVGAVTTAEVAWQIEQGINQAREEGLTRLLEQLASQLKSLQSPLTDFVRQSRHA